MALSGVRISWLIFASRSDLADDAFLGLALGVDKFRFRFLPWCEIAEHGAQLVRRIAKAPHGHEQRQEPALADAADHLAAAVEHARDPRVAHAVEVGCGDIGAFRREQIEERPAGEILRVVAEQRLGAAVDRANLPRRIEHDHAVGRGIEDGVKFGDFGFRTGEFGAYTVTHRRWCRRVRPVSARLRRAVSLRRAMLRWAMFRRRHRASWSAARAPIRLPNALGSVRPRCGLCRRDQASAQTACLGRRRPRRCRAQGAGCPVRPLRSVRRGCDGQLTAGTPHWHRAFDRAGRSARRTAAGRRADACRRPGSSATPIAGCRDRPRRDRSSGGA